MHIFEGDPSIAIDVVPEGLGILDRWQLAKMYSHLAIDSQNHYRQLGETRIDEDPAPGTLGDLLWRVEDFEEMGKLHIVAYSRADLEIDNPESLLRDIDARPDALKGMVKISRVGDVTEFEECNVRSTHREQKLARTMLWLGAHFIPEGDKVIAEIHESNVPAQGMWEHLTLERDRTASPKQYGIFTGSHRLYHTTALKFRESVGVSPTESFV
jgi:hypothetical protein